jgi:hypothetical protein
VTATAPPAAADPFDAWADLLPLWGRFADDGDIPFYGRLATEHGGPSVELGIGYGRVAQHVAPDFGIDASGVMLERAARCAPTTQLIRSDLRVYALPEPARFSYAPLNTFDGITDDEALRAVLARVREQTVPGGHLAFDGERPDPALGRTTQRIVRLAGTDGTVAIFATHDLVDADSGEVEITAFVDYLDATGHVRARRYFPAMPYRARCAEQWEAVLSATGWEVVARWGGFAGERLTGSEGRQVWLVRRT